MRGKPAWFAIVLMLAAAAALVAHHPSTAEFDMKKPVKVEGTVTKVEWTNPHAYFFVDVTDQAGKVANWRFQTGSPSQLTKRTWTRTTLKTGDKVAVDGFLARKGANYAAAVSVKTADGRVVFSGRIDD